LRRRKLPDPPVLANVGSFFKNPVVSKGRWKELQSRFPDLAAHPEPEGRVKLAAGWMIDRLGWKGLRRGSVGVYADHALVLVNYGGATGQEVMLLAHEIRESVRQAFDVDLEIEPRVY
jgi:UDP-N-acetylmuramate dehydrogenase